MSCGCVSAASDLQVLQALHVTEEGQLQLILGRDAQHLVPGEDTYAHRGLFFMLLSK